MINHKSKLSAVNQAFIDAIIDHNGEKAQTKATSINTTSDSTTALTSDELRLIPHLLGYIDSEDYTVWIEVGMALHHVYEGSEEGLRQFDKWSRGGSTYKGVKETGGKWNSFNSDRSDAMGMGTLIHYAQTNGADIDELKNQAIEPFQKLPMVTAVEQITTESPLHKYSLMGESAMLDAISANHKVIMYGLISTGQATVIYAKPNSGKTLITINALLEAIVSGELKGFTCYYLNMDDSAKGLAEKNKLFEDADVHLIAHGYQNFDVEKFYALLKELADDPSASQTIIVMDTLTRFADTMKVSECREFSALVRAFVVKGGTVIALAHTNKNKDDRGKLVPSGVANILNDFDCGYTMDCPDVPAGSNYKAALLENIKRRGNVELEAAFRFANETNITYPELVASVERIDPSEIGQIKQEANLASDSDGINAVKQCIAEGTVTKMELAKRASKLAGVSKRSMIQLIDKYTGEDPEQHLWTFDVKERGAKHFRML